MSARRGRIGPPAGGRAADVIDRHIGDRLRQARASAGMTQEALAARLGVSFQQLQKYETGKNRISASRLHYAARVLGVPVSYFFPAPEAAPADEPGRDPSDKDILDLIARIDAGELKRLLSGLDDPAARRQVLDLIRSAAAPDREIDGS